MIGNAYVWVNALKSRSTERNQSNATIIVSSIANDIAHRYAGQQQQQHNIR